MKTSLLLLSSLLFIMSARAADPAKASELVRVSEVEIFLESSFKATMASPEMVKSLTTEQRTCYSEVPDGYFKDAAAAYFTKLLSDEQADAALAFYKSPAGIKWLGVLRAMISRTAPPEASDEERNQIKAFRASSVGEEMMNPGKMVAGDLVKQRVMNLLRDKYVKCGEPKD